MSPSIEQAKEYIDALDFSMIVKKITRADVNISRVWSEQQATEAIQLYKNFLLLNKKHKHQFNLVPSLEIDEIWHHHILDTSSYVRDCENIFGELLHHFPYFGMRGPEDEKNLAIAFDKTQELYYLEFGEYVYEIFPSES